MKASETDPSNVKNGFELEQVRIAEKPLQLERADRDLAALDGPPLEEQLYAAAAKGDPVAESLARAHAEAEKAVAKRQAQAGGGNGRRKTAAIEPEAPVKDYGHAAVLARNFCGRYRWAPHRDSWMEWDGKVWQPVEEERVAKLAADSLRAEYAAQLAMAPDKTTIGRLTALVHETCVFARIMGALSFLKGWEGILTRAEEWDADLWAFNCANGIVDLRTGRLAEHDPMRLLTKLAPVDFNPETRGTAWAAHLERFLPNADIRRQVQRDLGLALVGASVEELLPIWYGTGANGKTTTAKVLRRTLGDYVGEAAPNLLIQTKFERHPTELADLAGRRLVFSSEVGQGKRLDEEVVKRLSGGDVKKGRFMRTDFFDIEQTFTIFMIVNHHPGITGVDQAIWRRVRLIPWTVQVSEEDRLPQDEIVERLAAEGAAVLSWLLAGLADWQQDRKWIAPEVRAVTAAYRAEQDRLGAFLEEACEEAPHFTVPVATFYENYSCWCTEAGEEPLGKTALSRRLKERGKTSKRAGHENETTWFCIRLKADLRRHATPSSLSPLENDSMPDKQENDVAPRRTEENGLGLVDSETLRANAERLATYLNDETVPFELREKREGEYKGLVEEMTRRQGDRMAAKGGPA